MVIVPAMADDIGKIRLLTLWVRDDARSRLTGPHMGQGADACTWNSQPDTYKTFTFTFHLAHPPDNMRYLFI